MESLATPVAEAYESLTNSCSKPANGCSAIEAALRRFVLKCQQYCGKEEEAHLKFTFKFSPFNVSLDADELSEELQDQYYCLRKYLVLVQQGMQLADQKTKSLIELSGQFEGK